MTLPAPSANGRHHSIMPATNPINHASQPPPPTIAGYLDRITIAGLHNYLYATDFYEKVVWILTFLVSIVGTMFYLVPTIQQYLEYTIVLDIQHRVEPGLVLPTVWVCTPGINNTYYDEYHESVRSQLMANKRTKLTLKRMLEAWIRALGPIKSEYEHFDPKTGLFHTIPSIWNSETGVWEWEPGELYGYLSAQVKMYATFAEINEVDRGPQLALNEALNEQLSSAIEIMGANWTGYKAFYEQGMFQCESTMKNCSLNGIPFDCCRADPVGRVRVTGKCFKVDLAAEAATIYLYPNRTSKFELSLETIIDSTHLSYFQDSEASATDISFGNRMPTLFESRLPLGAGSISTITVRGIQIIEETNCTGKFRPDPHRHANSHPIIRNFFDEMSKPNEYSVSTCEIGMIFEELYTQCGCVVYYDTMRPQNDSVICRPQHINICVYGAFQETAPAASSSTNKSSSKSTPIDQDRAQQDQAKQDLLMRVKKAASEECLPLCNSWTYDFVSSTMISAGSAGDISRYYRNKAIIIFEPEYRVEQEMYKMDYHALIASLGDGFGLILGISGITLIQIPIWTVAAVLLKRKLNRITPLQGRQGRPTGIPHVQRTAV